MVDRSDVLKLLMHNPQSAPLILVYNLYTPLGSLRAPLFIRSPLIMILHLMPLVSAPVIPKIDGEMQNSCLANASFQKWGPTHFSDLPRKKIPNCKRKTIPFVQLLCFSWLEVTKIAAPLHPKQQRRGPSVCRIIFLCGSPKP